MENLNLELKAIKEKYFESKKDNKALLNEVITRMNMILKNHDFKDLDYSITEHELNRYYFNSLIGIIFNEYSNSDIIIDDKNEEKERIKKNICIKRYLENNYGDNKIIQDLLHRTFNNNKDKVIGVHESRLKLKKEIEAAVLPIFNEDINTLLDIVIDIAMKYKIEVGRGKNDKSLSKALPGFSSQEEVQL